MKTYACVLSTNNYLNGVLVLNENLKRLNSKYDLLCLINENISEESKHTLTKYGIKYKQFNSVPYNVNFSSMWNYTFDKFNVFLLEDYEKVVCLDADLLILENLDFLFEYETPAMVIDNPTFTDRFNSGVMVITPNKETFKELVRMKEQQSLYNRVIGDQNILNDYYLEDGTINRIPDEYNVLRTITDEKVLYLNPKTNVEEERYKVVLNAIVDNPVVLHYVGKNKPFYIDIPYADPYSDLYQEYLNIIKEKGE